MRLWSAIPVHNNRSGLRIFECDFGKLGGDKAARRKRWVFAKTVYRLAPLGGSDGDR